MSLDTHIFDPGEPRRMLEEQILPPYITSCRWFGGKARRARKFTISDLWSLPGTAADTRLALVRIEYGDDTSDLYQLPLRLTRGADAARITSESPQAVIARDGDALLFDALYDAAFRDALVALIAANGTARDPAGELAGLAGTALPRLLGGRTPPLPSRVLKVEQSNSAVIYGDGLFLKIFRKLAEGVNPDAEILRFLTERRHFTHAPAFGGELVFRAPGHESHVLALGLGVVPNDGDAWSFVLRELAGFYHRADSAKFSDAAVHDAIGSDFLARAAQLGRRTGEMHVALAEATDDPAFAPEPFTATDQRELAAAIIESLACVFAILRAAPLVGGIRTDVERLLAAEPVLRNRAGSLATRGIVTMKTRHHGDFHLGQVLNTGVDFTIIDFEGEPSRPLAERRRKRSPLRDVAGMLRSFHYAAHSALRTHPGSHLNLDSWAEVWSQLITRAFLDAWTEVTAGAPFIPRDPSQTSQLLDAFLLEKALYEIDYELNNRPDWLPIPLRGLLALAGIAD
jgi:maltose alpha-D-glucosyltransferase/alpha-amylase